MERTVLREGRWGYAPRTACGILVVALLLAGCAAAAHPERIEDFHGREVAAKEVIVKFRGAPPQLAGERGLADHIDDARVLGGTRAVRLHSRSRNVDDLIRELSARPDVEYVEPNYVVHALSLPDDPYFGQLWGLSRIGAPAAWDISTGSASEIVAVVDTGLDYTHPDLVAGVWSAPRSFTVTIGGQSITCPAGSHGFNAITHTCDPMDDHNHGTHVSGTIAAAGNNGIGVTGVTWHGSIMGVKFLDSGGSGYLSDAIEAIDFTVQAREALGDDARVRVLSNSWAGGGFSQALLDEIRIAEAHDMLFVAAAGNAGSDNDAIPTYPSGYDAPGVIAVAATDSSDALASFSNYGATTVDLAAPGVSILSTVRGGAYASSSGTSMATPHVSGAALLVLSACPLDTAGLKTALLGTVDPVPSLAGRVATGGRLNVARAIRSCSGPPATPTTTALTASPGSSVYGEPVTLTATVTGAGGMETPTGTVSFISDGGYLGSRPLVDGRATIMTSSLTAVVHTLSASYGGDFVFSGSTSPGLSFRVDPAPTSLVLTASRESAPFGDPVTFTATVTPSSATGTARFMAGDLLLGEVPVNASRASVRTSALPAGDHTITASFGGNINYIESSGSLPFTVSRGTSSTILTTDPNPSVAGHAVNFTALVSPPVTTGMVTFSDGDAPLGTVALLSGRAWYMTSGLSAGIHTITATYSGDPSVDGSTSPPVTHTVTSAPPPDFSLSASPGSLSLVAGTSGTSSVTVEGLNGFTGAVDLAVTGVPAGATATLAPVATQGTSTLTVVTGTAQPGTYSLTITGTSGDLTRTTMVTVAITDFSLTATPAAMSLMRGTNGVSMIMVKGLNGFSGTVNLAVSGAPAGATATLNPAATTGPSTLSIVSGTAAPGTYTLAITGTSGGASHTTTVILTITDFSVTVLPQAQSVVRGSSTSYTVTISRLSGYPGNVTLSVTGMPSRATASFSPVLVTNPATQSALRITTGSKTPTGTYTLTVTGVSGSLARSSTVTLRVTRSNGLMSAGAGEAAGEADEKAG